MAIIPTDINFVLSGGIYNDEPKLSLGGFPSPTPISDTINNLFTDITPSQASAGKTDYRCFYIFNDNVDDSMYKCTLFLQPTILDASTPTIFSLGMLFRNEIQTISFTPNVSGSTPVEGGSFRLKIDSLQTDLITYSENNTILAANMETALKEILEDDVTVTYTTTTDDIKKFTVTFYGINQNKTFGVIDSANNSITPTHTITAIRTISGSPINTVAPDIGNETTIPNGVNFTQPSSNGLEIGTLRAAEGFPIWVKRTIPFLAESLDNDGVRIEMRVKSSPTI